MRATIEVKIEDVGTRKWFVHIQDPLRFERKLTMLLRSVDVALSLWGVFRKRKPCTCAACQQKNKPTPPPQAQENVGGMRSFGA